MAVLRVVGDGVDRLVPTAGDEALGLLVRELAIRFSRGDAGAWLTVDDEGGGRSLLWVSSAHVVTANFDAGGPPSWLSVSLSAIDVSGTGRSA
ncbi:hypothetical protein [Nocardioides nanhaiensis]|uniref:Uncharacterized protein n=1 Tax=Nocardioides nanhaiensis TaxID=1476871 RepID=A0ABP8X1P0_9ACTN